MNKKFYFFEISYKIRGYQKVMFNRYKKIEAILSKSGYIPAGSKEVLKEDLFKKQKEKIIKEINETGDFVFRDFLIMANGGGKYSSEYYKEYLKLPPRIKGEKILDIDLTVNDIDILLQKNREKNENQYFSSQPNWFSYVINSFGVSANPNERPELSERLLEEIKKKGVEIINE